MGENIMIDSSELLIEEVFNDNIFKMFINYCLENELSKIGQLENFNFDNLDNIKGFGKGKKEKLIEKYSEIISGEFNLNINDGNIEGSIKRVERISELLDCYKDLDICCLECFNKISTNIIEQIKLSGIITINDLCENINTGTLNVPNLGQAKVKHIIEALDNFKKDSKELFEILMNSVKEHKEYPILVERSVNDITLQQIGERLEISRERVRQKEKKIVKVVEAIINIFIGIQNLTEAKLLNVEEIIGVYTLDLNDKLCLEYVLKNSDLSQFEYLEDVNKFLVNGNFKYIKDMINIIANSLPDIVNINSELKYELIEYESLNIFELEDVVNIILTLGYKRVNDYIFRGAASKEKKYNFIIKEFFKKGITFSSEDDVNKLLQISREKFDLEEEAVRNIKVKIERFCVLCDRGSYIHPDWIDVDEYLLLSIKEFIDDSNQDTLYLHQIYSQFEGELNQIGINNRYYLQGILKYYYGEVYNFTKDTLYKGNIKRDRNYIFNNYIKSKGRLVTKDEMENDLKGWTTIMFNMASDECKNVLKWENGSMIHASLINLSLADINDIEDELDNIFNSGVDSVTDNELFERLNYNSNNVFKENDIDSAFKLFSLLECVLSRKYYFRRPYIVKDKPKEAISSVSLMKKLFKNEDKVTLDQLKNFCNNIKLNDNTRMQAINRLLKETIEIEKEVYILVERFEIEEKDIDKVRELIINLIKEKGYIALNSITDYTVFPQINYGWNSILLREICENYIPEVKELKKQFYDKRYPVPVLVEESSEMNEILDLVGYILKNDFYGREDVKIYELTEYLKVKNIIYDRLPCEIYNCEEIAVNDNSITVRR